MRFRFSLATAFACGAGVFLLAIASCDAAELSFWVWNRTAPLTEAETQKLDELQVRELFWHVGELENRSGAWRWRRPPVAPPSSRLRVVQVVRLEPPFERAPFSGAALDSLLARLKELAAEAAVDLQLDCDTPDRLLPEYAVALGRIREVFPRLTITALAGWSRSPHWRQLQEGVEEMFPMFYDLQADVPAVGSGAMPRPLIESVALTAQLREWSRCRIPWRAGLPNFARLTVYDRAGKSRGHVRSWRWDDVCFNRLLIPVAPPTAGTTLFRMSANGFVAATALREGEWLAARWPDRAALARAMEEAQANGARGVTLFRLPDGSDPAAWSLATIGSLRTESAPLLVLRKGEGESLVLVNDSPVDLEPRLAGPGGEGDRGYALELDAAVPIWREAEPGQFWRVTAHVDPDAKPAAVPIPLATRLTFWFSHLRAGESLRTALLQVAPGASLGAVRYRVLHSPGATEWRHIENAEPHSR